MENFKYQIVNNKEDIEADYLLLSKVPKKGMIDWPASFSLRDSLVINTDQLFKSEE